LPGKKSGEVLIYNLIKTFPLRNYSLTRTFPLFFTGCKLHPPGKGIEATVSGKFVYETMINF